MKSTPLRLTTANRSSAVTKSKPRTKFAAILTLSGAILTYFALDFTSIYYSKLILLLSLSRRFRSRCWRRGRLRVLGLILRHLATVTNKLTGRRKFTQPMANHVFHHHHVNKVFAIVHAKHKANHARRDYRTARPSFDRCFVAGFQLFHFAEQAFIDKRPFF